MAKLRPSELPEEVRREPFRRSEIMFYDYARLLPDNWFVLYGVTWYVRVRNNSWSEGEADFVILSPETGLVVIEIKGGRIGRDDKGWYSVDRNQETHRIKDPALQAANCKHNLLRCIREKENFSSRFIPARHMVCFPNVSEKDSPILIDVPREMQILSEDFNHLKNHILEFANRNYDAIDLKNSKLTPRECSEIADILKPNFDCPNRWSTQAHKQEIIMDALTDEQSYLWEIMGDNDRMALYGPAGSGKTILALKLIKQVVKNGGSALALLPSVALQHYYSASIQSDKLTVSSYQRLEGQSYDKNIYSLIVIDEAQDLSEDEWLVLYEMFRIQESKKLVCVFDSNQKLKSFGQSCPIENLIPLRLSKILRNTKQIGEFSSKFFSGDRPCTVVGPNGAKVQFTTIEDSSNISDEISKLIAHYVFEEGFNYSDIAILFADNEKTKFKKIANHGNSIGVSFRSSKGFNTSYVHKSPIVIAESVFSFRGLESKIVILTGLDNLKSQIKDAACYIGISRARNILHIIAEPATVKALQKR